MEQTAFQKIITFLEKNKISYQQKEHPPTYTSEQSATYRNEPLKIGAKALILKTDTEFIMCVISAAKKLDSKKVKEKVKSKKLRFATIEEVKKITFCVPGAIPPFGNIFNINTLVDKSIEENEDIAFNAGSLTNSIKIKSAEYRRALKPVIVDISQ